MKKRPEKTVMSRSVAIIGRGIEGVWSLGILYITLQDFIRNVFILKHVHEICNYRHTPGFTF
jgi:hypothetical protein